METRIKLATELEKQAANADNSKAALYRTLAERAKTGEFDDYSNVHVCGPTELHRLLKEGGLDRFARRVANGEFDATLEESEEWARSQNDPETIRIMEAMGIGPDRSRDQ